MLTSSLTRLRAVDQLSPHSAVGRPGPRSVSAPGRLSQGRTQRVPDGRPIWPQCSHTVSAKHSSAMGAGACSRENHLGATHHYVGSIVHTPGNSSRPWAQARRLRFKYTIDAFRSNERSFLSYYIKAGAVRRHRPKGGESVPHVHGISTAAPPRDRDQT